MNGLAHLATYAPLLPEIIVIGGAMLLLMLGVFRDHDSVKPAETITWLAIALLALAGFAVMSQGGGTQTLFGEAVMEASKVFHDTVKEIGFTHPMLPSVFTPFNTPLTWQIRTFIMAPVIYTYKDPARNKNARTLFEKLIDVAAQHGWTDYRTAPAFQDKVAGVFSFNNHALLRFHETLKDAVDPNGILSPGRAGIWPKNLRSGRKA